MPETIANRLKEASDQCSSAYAAWFEDQQNAQAIEALQDAVHELRRIAARLEIDIGHSETRAKPKYESDEGNGKGPNGNRDPSSKSGGRKGGGGGQRRNRKPKQ